MSEHTKDRRVRNNFYIFIIAWTVTTFNNFLLQFLVNTYELVYPSALGLSCAEFIGFLFGSILFRLSNSLLLVRIECSIEKMYLDKLSDLLAGMNDCDQNVHKPILEMREDL